MPCNIKKTLMNIRLRRETLNYTQSFMAKKLKLTPNAYSKIESGVTQMTLQRLGEIADILLTLPTALLEN